MHTKYVFLLFTSLVLFQPNIYGQTNGSLTASNQQIDSMSVQHLSRNGMTYLFSGGLTLQNADVYFGRQTLGVEGPNLGIGRFLGDDVALLLRVLVANGFYERNNHVLSLFLGITTQYWANEQVFFELGAGYAGTSVNQGIGGDDGIGLSGRIGFKLSRMQEKSLFIDLSYSPLFLGVGRLDNTGITLGYQIF